MIHRSILLALLTWLLAFAGPALAAPFQLNYSGRLTEASGKPAAGPVDLSIKFFRQSAGGAPLSVTPQEFADVTLSAGMFAVQLTLSPTDFGLLFTADEEVWAEVTDTTSGKVYARQRFSAVPYALRIPVDSKTMAWTADGKLTLSATPENNKVLSASGGQLTWIDLPGGGDMMKSTYDAGGTNGVVDNAEKLGNEAPSFYRNASNINAGTLADAHIPASIARDTELPVINATSVGAAGAVMDSDYANGKILVGTAVAGNYVQIDNNSANWNTAFSWGDHSAAGYLNLTALSAGAPLSYNNTTGAFSIGQASGVSDGYLTSGDFVTFNNKQAEITGATNLTLNSVTANTEIRLNNDLADAAVTLKAKDDLLAPYTLTLPENDGDNGNLLVTDGNGALYWAAPAGGGDMMSAVYDNGTNGSVAGVVDDAEDAARLGGEQPDFYLNATNITSGTLAEARIHGDIARDSEIPAAARGSLSGTAPITYDNGTGAIGINAATTSDPGSMSAADKSKLDGIEAGADVTDAANVAAAGAVMDGDFSANGLMKRSAAGTYTTVTDNSANWDIAYDDRLKWDGGSTGLNATTAKTSLGLDNVQNTNILTSWSQNDAQFIGTDEIRARDAGGLKLNDDSGTAGLFVQDGGNVGIGTGSPGFRLDVSSTTPAAAILRGADTTTSYGASGAVLRLQNTDPTNNNYSVLAFSDSTATTTSGIYSKILDHTNHYANLSFATRGSSGTGERLTILADGNVGIGATSPADKLNVEGGALVIRSSAGAPGVPGTTNGLALQYDYTNGGAYFRAHSTAGSTTMGFFTSNAGTNAERVRLDSLGNVGIGTTNPGDKLHVAGKVRATHICFTDGTNCKDVSTSWGSGGSVTSVDLTAPAAGITTSGGPVTTSGSITLALANDLAAVEGLSGTGLAKRTAADTWTTVTDNYANWDSAYTDRLKWDGGSTGLNATTAKTSLGLENVQNTNVLTSWSQDDSQYIGTDEIRARDAGGLKLFDDSGTSGLFVKGGGDVGIGTTAPAGRLHVSGGNALLDNNYALMFKNSSGTQRNVLFFAADDAVRLYGPDGGLYLNPDAGTTTHINYNAGASIVSLVAGTSTGKVGIGTSSPGQKLSVAGTFGLLETGGSPQYYTIFQGGDQTANVTYTLPTAAPGADGQVLTSTTGGVMSWSSVQGADATLSGIASLSPSADQLIYATGADTFGTSSLTAAGRAILDDVDAGAQRTTLGLGSVQNINIQNNFTQNDAQYIATDEIRARDAGGLKLYDDSGAVGLVVQDGGNVGVGTSGPSEKLQIDGGNILISEGANVWHTIAIQRTGAEAGSLNTKYSGTIAVSSTAGNDALISNSAGNGLRILNASGDGVFSGNVGVGDSTPGAKLEVSANGSASDLLMLSADDAGNGDVFIVKNNGNVGIGTNSPGSRLVVSGGSLTVSGAGMSWGSSGSPQGTLSYAASTAILRSASSKDLTFETNGLNERMRITSGGNVGIGTTTPGSYKVNIKGDNNNSVAIDNDGSQYTAAYWLNNGTVGAGIQLDNTNNNFRIFGQGVSQKLSLGTQATDRLTIDTSGNVTIGNASGVSPLTVHSASGYAKKHLTLWDSSAGTQKPGLNLRVDATDLYQIYADNSDSNKLKIDKFDGVTAMTVTSGGDVGIGTTGPAAKLDINGDIRLGNSAATCNGTTEGSQRYNSTSKRMEFCDGTTWASVVGDKVLIETVALSNTATVDFLNLSNTYSTYEVEFIDVIPVTDAVSLYARVSTDNGSTWKSGATDYAYQASYFDYNAGPTGGGNMGNTQMLITNNAANARVGNAVGEGMMGRVTIHNPSSSATYKMVSLFMAYVNETAENSTFVGTAMYKSATAINGIRFFFSSGNFSSGTVKLYGIR